MSYGHSSEKPRRIGEGEVEQRLVALALDELVGAALGPDRLADAPQPAPRAGVRVDELAPRRDDARGVDADLGHVGEGHPLGGVGPELLAQPAIFAALTTTSVGSLRCHRIAQERQRPVDEAVVAGVEQGLVTESRCGPGLDVVCSGCHPGHPREDRNGPPAGAC